MDFSLSDTQEMLADSIDKFIENEYDFDTRQEYAASETGYSAAAWQTFAELGWTSVPFSEEDNGFGGDALDTMVVMQRIGKGLIVEPYLANVVLAGGVLKRCADSDQKARWLIPMMAGELQLALGFVEPQSRYELNDVATTATRQGDTWKISGTKTYVLNGRHADVLIVAARSDDGQHDKSGISLFAIDRNADGVSIHDYATVDGLQAADVVLVDVVVNDSSRIGEAGGGYDVLDATVAEATLAVCAEAVGIMQVLKDKTVEYSKNRVQFGVPIGSFQALQHRMVDMLTDCEQCQSMLLWATLCNAEAADDAKRAVSALKYLVSTAGRKLGEEAVQLHGGMGVTWELDVAHYFKRLVAIGQIFGNADWHLDKLAEAP